MEIRINEMQVEKKMIISERIFLLGRKADVDIYHTHLQSKEFICLSRLTEYSCNIVLLQCENYQIQLQMHQWNRYQALLIYISSHQEKHSLSEFPYR